MNIWKVGETIYRSESCICMYKTVFFYVHYIKMYLLQRCMCHGQQYFTGTYENTQKDKREQDLTATVPGEDISAEDTADDVSQVGDVVDIRQGTGYQDVSLALLWQTGEKKRRTEF